MKFREPTAGERRFGAALDAALVDLGVGQATASLAHSLGVSERTVRNWRKGMGLTPGRCAQIATELKRSPAQMFGAGWSAYIEGGDVAADKGPPSMAAVARRLDRIEGALRAHGIALDEGDAAIDAVVSEAEGLAGEIRGEQAPRSRRRS